MSEHSPILVPGMYNQNYLQLMVVNPTTLYAYWELSERTITAVTRHYRTTWGQLPKIIRIYQDESLVTSIPQPGQKYTDTAVNEANSWYFTNVSPATAYVADLGTWNIYQQFIPIIRSNVIATPRNSASIDQQAHVAAPSAAASAPGSLITAQDTSPFPQFSTYTIYESDKGAKL